ncbi:hypothetical protein HRbin30_03254 [bacterium HR30]|nr:hypothetical protein HRbin30_03254 [bacterium HR30]
MWRQLPQPRRGLYAEARRLGVRVRIDESAYAHGDSEPGVPGRGLYGNAHSYTDTNGDAAGHTLADSQCHGNSKLYPHTEAFAYLHQHPNRFGNTEPDAIAPTFANANGEPVGNSESNLDVDASTQ